MAKLRTVLTPRRLHQPEVIVEHLPDEIIGLTPQVVGVVLASWRVTPHNTLDVVVFAVDQQFPAVFILVGRDLVCRQGLAHKWHIQGQRDGQDAADFFHRP